MPLYVTRTPMRAGGVEVIILDAASSEDADAAALAGLEEDGMTPIGKPDSRKISKAEARGIIAKEAPRCWVTI